MMKPIYYLLFSLLTLYACTDQQTELEESSYRLKFGVEAIEDTKGTVTTTRNLSSMSVFCAHTGADQYRPTATCNWMHNAKVTRTDENPEWVVQGDGNKQWKDDGYHSFFAFAPHAPSGAVVSGSNVQGPPTLTYTVPADYTKQVDLLYSHTTPINCKQMYIGSRPVVFGFHHALSKITFEAKKETDIENIHFYIKEIRLGNIKSEGTLNFQLDNQGKEVVDGYWINIAKPINFSIIYNHGLQDKWLTNQMELISAEGTGLFVIPQITAETSEIVITYIEHINNIGTEKTLKLKLSDLLSEFQFGKSYRFSIVLKEDKVTITAQIQPWTDQTVDVAVPGTYLNVSHKNITAPYGSEAKIFYDTDAHEDLVNITCDKGIQYTANKANKHISIPAGTAVGNYTFTLTAGKLSQQVRVKIDYNDFIVEDGVAAPRIFVQGTGDDAKLMLTKSPANYGAYFQFMGITAWAYDESIKYQPVVVQTGSSWTSTNEHTVTSLNAGKGDPCRLVGYTKKQVQDMLQANTLPDNKKWKTPEYSSINIDSEARGGWAILNGVNGHFMLSTNTSENFLPAAGLAWQGGSFEPLGSKGAYWTQTSNGIVAQTVYIEQYRITKEWLQNHSLRMSVRCVRQ